MMPERGVARAERRADEVEPSCVHGWMPSKYFGRRDRPRFTRVSSMWGRAAKLDEGKAVGTESVGGSARRFVASKSSSDVGSTGNFSRARHIQAGGRRAFCFQVDVDVGRPGSSPTRTVASTKVWGGEGRSSANPRAANILTHARAQPPCRR